MSSWKGDEFESLVKSLDAEPLDVSEPQPAEPSAPPAAEVEVEPTIEALRAELRKSGVHVGRDGTVLWVSLDETIAGMLTAGKVPTGYQELPSVTPYSGHR